MDERERELEMYEREDRLYRFTRKLMNIAHFQRRLHFLEFALLIARFAFWWICYVWFYVGVIIAVVALFLMWPIITWKPDPGQLDDVVFRKVYNTVRQEARSIIIWMAFIILGTCPCKQEKKNSVLL